MSRAEVYNDRALSLGQIDCCRLIFREWRWRIQVADKLSCIRHRYLRTCHQHRQSQEHHAHAAVHFKNDIFLSFTSSEYRYCCLLASSPICRYDLLGHSVLVRV